MMVGGDELALDIRIVCRGPAHAVLTVRARTVIRTTTGVGYRAALRLVNDRLDTQCAVGACLGWKLATATTGARDVADLFAAKTLVFGDMAAIRCATGDEGVFV